MNTRPPVQPGGDASHSIASDKPQAKRWNWGKAWRDDKLYVFEPTSVLVMRLWPDMLAWRRTITKPWALTRRYADIFLSGCPRHFLQGRSQHKASLIGPPYVTTWKERAFSVFCPGSYSTHCSAPLNPEHAWWSFLEERENDTLEAALASIPLREQRIAGGFAQRRWQVLALMARCPGAADLMESNPALGFALANNWIYHRPAVKQPLRSARSLVWRKQTAILEWLAFPATERVRRILARINPGAIEARNLLHLQWALQDECVQQLLAHLPVISKDILRFVCHPDTRSRVAAKFLHQLAEDSAGLARTFDDDAHAPFDARPQWFKLWLDSNYMARYLGRDIPDAFKSLGQFQRWHDGLAMELQEGRTPEFREIATLNFASPPYPGTPSIKPLTTGKELLEEGTTMHNCVGSHHHRVLNGRYYVYRVDAPIRATLALECNDHGWQIAEIKGPYNQPIPQQLADAIHVNLLGRRH